MDWSLVFHRQNSVSWRHSEPRPQLRGTQQKGLWSDAAESPLGSGGPLQECSPPTGLHTNTRGREEAKVCALPSPAQHLSPTSVIKLTLQMPE